MHTFITQWHRDYDHNLQYFHMSTAEKKFELQKSRLMFPHWSFRIYSVRPKKLL